MTGAKIAYLVIGDMASARELLPVAAELQNLGAQCKFFADPGGDGLDLLIEQNVRFEARLSEDTDYPDVILAGTSAKAFFAQLAWTRFGRERGIPVVWYETGYGLAALEGVTRQRPDLLCVADEAAEELLADKGLKETMVVCGKPSNAGFVEVLSRRFAVKAQVREALGVRLNEYLVCYSPEADCDERALTHAGVLGKFAKLGEEGFRLAILFAPGTEDWARDQLVAEFRSGAAPLADPAAVEKFSAAELVVAADICIADWSLETGSWAMLADAIAIITLFPNDWVRRVKYGYPQGQPPIVEAKAVLSALDELQLDVCLHGAARYPAQAWKKIHEGQPRFYPLRWPDAAVRIAKAVLELTERMRRFSIM